MAKHSALGRSLIQLRTCVTWINNKNSNRGKNKKNRRNGRGFNPPSTALTYTGPISANVPSMAPVTRNMVYASTVASNALGSIAFQYVVAATSLNEWSNFAALYSEYRIMAARIRWIPNYTGLSTASTPALSSMAVLTLTRDGTIVTPSSVLNALSIAPRVVSNIYSRMSLTYRMSGPLEASFHNTDAPAVGVCTFCLNSDLLTASSSYGTIQADVMIQFRNPK